MLKKILFLCLLFTVVGMTGCSTFYREVEGVINVKKLGIPNLHADIDNGNTVLKTKTCYGKDCAIIITGKKVEE